MKKKNKEMWFIVIACALILIYILGAANRLSIEEFIEWNGGHCRECNGLWRSINLEEDLPTPWPVFGGIYVQNAYGNRYHFWAWELGDGHFLGGDTLYGYKCNICGKIVILHKEYGK